MNFGTADFARRSGPKGWAALLCGDHGCQMLFDDSSERDLETLRDQPCHGSQGQRRDAPRRQVRLVKSSPAGRTLVGGAIETQNRVRATVPAQPSRRRTHKCDPSCRDRWVDVSESARLPRLE